MNTQEIENYFKYQNANIKLIKIGYDSIRDQIKKLYRSVKNNDEYIFAPDDSDQLKVQKRQVEKSLFRILFGIQVSWEEESIKRLLYEKDLFTNVQQAYLIQISALVQKWYETLKIVFSNPYDLVPDADKTCRRVNIIRHKRNLDFEIVD